MTYTSTIINVLKNRLFDDKPAFMSYLKGNKRHNVVNI
jgi:hypothetical protein